MDNEIKKELFLSAYKKLGTLGAAATSAGINPTTVWRWNKSDPGFKEAFQQAQVEFGEELETRMFDLLDEQHTNLDYRSNPTLLIFALKGALPRKYGNAPGPSDDHVLQLLRELRSMYRSNLETEE